MSTSPKASPATRMLFRGSSSTLSAPQVSNVAVTGVTSQPQDTTSPPSSSRSRTTESVTSSPSSTSKGKSPLSLLSSSPAPSTLLTSPAPPSSTTVIAGSSSHLPSSHSHSHPPHPPRPPPPSAVPPTKNLPAASPPDERAIEEARTALLATLSNHFDREITPRAQLLHQNNAAINKQQNDLVRATAGLKKENDKLAKMVDGYSKKVKEVGNVQNWAEMLEREFLILEDTLRRVKEGDDTESEWSGSYSGSGWSGSEDGDDGEDTTRPEEVPLPEPGEGGL
ncbi:hypothetical protein QBC36DRAFT_322495 [Triangularia setosa]|uniref:Biogenesis of lysosome-related organelles complex 1 subunit 1 n=1 Tax=Triangularia setosa TaxID=2587417 RepID=A0AAN7A8P4_9PEZI|nr:hypothetical protein QBC36DRAFT_322495 [Podospora setosa]